ncbi:hypothetical protein ACX1C1_11660 [Paenibacillus sp. strain BS8-2]
MSNTKLSQWDALQLESLKALGWSNEQIIQQVVSGDLPKDESKFQFDYAGLRAVAADEPDTFKSAVENGYQIKYNTIRGIHSWILVALKQEAELILEPGAEAVLVALTEAEAAALTNVLSFGWAVSADSAAEAPDEEGRSVYWVAPAAQ